MTIIKNRITALEKKQNNTPKLAVIQLSPEQMDRYHASGFLPDGTKDKCAPSYMVVSQYDSVEAWEKKSKELHGETLGSA